MRRYATVALVTLAFGAVLAFAVLKAHEAAALRQVERYSTELEQISDRHWRRLADRYQSAKALSSSLSDSIAGLVSTVAELRSAASVTITAPPETLTVVEADTVRITEQPGIQEYLFERPLYRMSIRADTLAGYTWTPHPLTVTVLASRRADGSWWADVHLPDPLTASKVDLRVNDPGPNWWERNDQYVGYGLGVLTAAAVVYLLKP